MQSWKPWGGVTQSSFPLPNFLPSHCESSCLKGIKGIKSSCDGTGWALTFPEPCECLSLESAWCLCFCNTPTHLSAPHPLLGTQSWAPRAGRWARALCPLGLCARSSTALQAAAAAANPLITILRGDGNSSAPTAPLGNQSGATSMGSSGSGSGKGDTKSFCAEGAQLAMARPAARNIL